MKKLYLFICALLGVFGGTLNPAHAQETVTLSLGTSETRINQGSNSWTLGLAGTTTNVTWVLPSAESVKATFGGSTFVTGTGLYWGMGNGRDQNTDDFTNLTATGFKFLGRKAYNGAYVAQVYDLTDNASSVTASFSLSGAVSMTSFSIWKVTDDAATMLAASAESSTETNYSLTSDVLVKSGERLVFIWNCVSGGSEITISDFSASYTKVENTQDVDYTLTDAAGNEYTGTFEGVENVSTPTLTLPYNATITDGRWDNGTYKATVNFPFPVSNPEGTRQAVAIQSSLGTTAFLYANGSGNVIADAKSNTAPTEEQADNYLWYIYPALTDDGQFTFKLYNVGSAKYIPAAASTASGTATALSDENGAGAFAYTATGIANGAGFSVPGTQQYITINSGTSDGQNLWLWTKTGTTHRGSNLIIKDVATEFAALTASEFQKFELIDGATVISPTEYAATPAEINAAIDALETAKTSCDTDGKKLAFLLGSDATKITTFKAMSEQYGAPMGFTYTIKGGKWGTLFSPVNFTVPSGWTLYTCAAVGENGVLELSEYTAGVNKNHPFLVKNNNTEDVTYQIIGYSNGAATQNTTEGLLTGVIENETTLPAGSYILASGTDGSQAFHKIGEGVSKTAAVNKVYITLPEGSNARTVIYIEGDGNATSINGISCDANMADGKFIRNGKVVIVKNGVMYNVAGQREK